jgi:hypothetical protein
MTWILGIYLCFAGLTLVVGLSQWVINPKDMPWLKTLGVLILLVVIGPFMSIYHLAKLGFKHFKISLQLSREYKKASKTQKESK